MTTLFNLVLYLSQLKLVRFPRVKADSQDFYRCVSSVVSSANVKAFLESLDPTLSEIP
jgi:hypothetical protein